MSASFVAASSRMLVCATHPLTAYPVSVGLWVRPQTSGVSMAYWTLTDGGVTNQLFYIGQASSNNYRIAAQAGGTQISTNVGTLVTGGWAFLLGRFISDSNRRLSVLTPSGLISAGQSTTSRTFPTSAENISIGGRATSSPSEFLDGEIGEVWYTNTDIQPDGAALQEPLLRQLAYGGPFSVPHIAKDIIEYRSFRKGLTSATDEASEVYSGAYGRQTWTNTNGATLGQHPPLPGWYRKPGAEIIQFRRPSMVAAVSTAVAAGVTYPMLERGIRGLTRGVAMGSYH